MAKNRSLSRLDIAVIIKIMIMSLFLLLLLRLKTDSPCLGVPKISTMIKAIPKLYYWSLRDF